MTGHRPFDEIKRKELIRKEVEAVRVGGMGFCTPELFDRLCDTALALMDKQPKLGIVDIGLTKIRALTEERDRILRKLFHGQDGVDENRRLRAAIGALTPHEYRLLSDDVDLICGEEVEQRVVAALRAMAEIAKEEDDG